MSRHRSALVLAAVTTLGATACVDSGNATAPRSEPGAPSRDVVTENPVPHLGADAEMERIALRAPGFGGMFYDADGRLNVYMTESARRSDAARQAVLDRVDEDLSAGGRRPDAGNAIVLAATRDFAELVKLRDRLFPILAAQGVVYTDIDEAHNQLRVGVLADAAQFEILDKVKALGVPADAVTLEVTPPIRPLVPSLLEDVPPPPPPPPPPPTPTSTLQWYQTPIGGGLQIGFRVDEQYIGLCTLGFNVLRGAALRDTTFFFTNSHCTNAVGSVTPTDLWMPWPPPFPYGHYIGVEVIDPPFFAHPCYVGWLCRASDAALVRFIDDAPAKLGTIYRTKFYGTGGAWGSIDIDESAGNFFIATEERLPMIGDVVDKMGRTTGWTRGPVVGTCLNFLYALDPPQVMLCQDVVAAGSTWGDSGSPVFQPLGKGGTVKLYGMLWGGFEDAGGPMYIYSEVDDLRFDFGWPEECRATPSPLPQPLLCRMDRTFRTH